MFTPTSTYLTWNPQAEHEFLFRKHVAEHMLAAKREADQDVAERET